MNLQRRSVFVHIICFCLTGSAVGSSSASPSINGPQEVTVLGPGVVTVGIPASFFCFSVCSPACVYRIMAAGRSADAGEISITIRERLDLTVTCRATNTITGHTAEAQHTLQVLQGPENVSISGPAFLPLGRPQSFLCSAVCWPSCVYRWSSNGVALPASGNHVTVTPSSDSTRETLVCSAFNNVSGLFASAVLKLHVTDGPLHTTIRGPDRIRLDSSTPFECLSRCKPSCNYTWTAENHTRHGKTIHASAHSWREPLTLTCTATNTITNVTEVALKMLRVTENAAAPVRMNVMSAFVIVLSLRFI